MVICGAAAVVDAGLAAVVVELVVLVFDFVAVSVANASDGTRTRERRHKVILAAGFTESLLGNELGAERGAPMVHLFPRCANQRPDSSVNGAPIPARRRENRDRRRLPLRRALETIIFRHP
jgi:hypothetical protein